MKTKLRKKLEAKRERIASATNNGWLNLALRVACKECTNTKLGAYCKFHEAYLNEEKGCVKEAYEAKNDRENKSANVV